MIASFYGLSIVDVLRSGLREEEEEKNENG